MKIKSLIILSFMFILSKIEEWLINKMLKNHVTDTEFQFKIKYTLEVRKAKSSNW